VIVDRDELHNLKVEIFNATVNPLANIICTFLASQVTKGALTKDEAKYVIASAVDILNMANVEDDIREIGADMLMRMVQAIGGLPD
jgi:hypothetical protein